MSDHFDLLDFQAPDPSKAALDVTGLYAFQSPADPTRSVLVLAVNPFTLAPAFDPEAVYRIDVDTDGDLRADLAFSVVFSDPGEGEQAAIVRRAVGPDARFAAAMGEVVFDAVAVSPDDAVVVAEAGGFRFYAGRRSDPFFADAEGLFNGYRFTGNDAFGDKDVFAIALELPNEALGPGRVAVWGRTIASEDGRLAQMDRTGGANLLNFLTYGTPDEIKPYREGEPADDRAHFAERYAKILVSVGYEPADAAAKVADLLPDVLHYDHRQPAGFPNGRGLSDDLADLALSLITNGRHTTDGVGPHDDLEPAFPHLGRPHAGRSHAAGISLRSSTPADTDALYSVWRRSVEATHHFLAPEHLESISGIVRSDYLPATTLLVAVDGHDTPVGFLGGEGDVIESLFVDPAWHRQGVGRRLVEAAFDRSPVTRLDVNEANDGARAFYRRMGFLEVGRSETDENGLPYPVIHLERRAA